MSDFRGAAREMVGRVQEKVGEFTGDNKTQAEGYTIRQQAKRSNKSPASAT